MKIGFTGTQRGMTEHQRQQVMIMMASSRREITQIHHGGCVGADTQFYAICRSMHLVTNTVHPASDVSPEKIADLDYVILLKAKPALERNHDIVDSVDVMIATPAQDHEVLRSGTWATIRYAKKVGRVIHTIYPNK